VAVVLGVLLFDHLRRVTGKDRWALLGVGLYAGTGLVLGWFTVAKTLGLSALFMFAGTCALTRRGRVATPIGGALLGLAVGNTLNARWHEHRPLPRWPGRRPKLAADTLELSPADSRDGSSRLLLACGNHVGLQEQQPSFELLGSFGCGWDVDGDQVICGFAVADCQDPILHLGDIGSQGRHWIARIIRHEIRGWDIPNNHPKHLVHVLLRRLDLEKKYSYHAADSAPEPCP
jgi:hypothetical protein